MFADVILPLPLPGTFTYSIPAEMERTILPGCRVTVPLGSKKSYTALVVALHDKKPEEYEVKEIKELLDEIPIVTSIQTRLWEWISRYYLCSLGDIYKAAIPQGLKGFRAATINAVTAAYQKTLQLKK